MPIKTPFAHRIAALTVEIDQTCSAMQLLPAGRFRAVDGRPYDCDAWVIDADIASAVIAKAAARTNPMVIDYEHQTLYAAQSGKPAPAAGWFKPLEWRDGIGLYAIHVDWNDRASTMIAAREYRYVSAVFAYDKQGHVIEILHAALTNNPALDGMDEIQIAALTRLASLSSDQPNQEQNMDELLEQLRWLLNLPVGATADDVKAQLQKLITQLGGEQGIAAASVDLPAMISKQNEQIVALTAQVGKADPARYVPISVMKDLQEKVAALTAQVNASTVADLVDVALSDGRLLPAQESWARELGKTNLAALSQYLESAPQIAALSGTQTCGRNPDASGAALDDTLLAVCSMFGNDPAAVQKTLSQEKPQ